MDSEEKKVKLQLIKTVNNIKKKFQHLHKQRQDMNDSLSLQYKPILEPMRDIIANTSNIKGDKNHFSSNQNESNEKHETHLNNEYQKYNSDAEPLSSSHMTDDDSETEETPHTDPLQSSSHEPEIETFSLEDYKKFFGTKEHDKKYGVYFSKLLNSLMIGRTKVSFNARKIIIGKKRFTLTKGLLNLLFLHKPEPYTHEDILQYKEIISITNIHKKYYDTSSTLKSDANNSKFKNIIAPLFARQGASIQTNFMRVYENSEIDYKYWDNPNELVDRLRLLIASQSAGHTGHNNEIIAIIEELKEANIIK